jgi:hypothetical protein
MINGILIKKASMKVNSSEIKNKMEESKETKNKEK